MRRIRLGKINIWKWAFLLLLAANLAFVAVIASRIIQIREPASQQSSTTTKGEDVKIGTLTSNKEEVNQALTSFLEPYQTDQLSYQVTIGSTTVLFEGSYELLGYQIPLYIYFDANPLETGAIQLKVTSFSVGTLSLPQSQVLQYLQSRYDLPKFVEVNPSESTININLQDVSNSQGLYLKATQLNLLTDTISFDIFKKKQ